MNNTITSIIQAKSSQLYMYTDNGEKQGLLTFDSNEIIPLTDDNKSLISFLLYIFKYLYFLLFNFKHLNPTLFLLIIKSTQRQLRIYYVFQLQ